MCHGTVYNISKLNSILIFSNNNNSKIPHEGQLRAFGKKRARISYFVFPVLGHCDQIKNGQTTSHIDQMKKAMFLDNDQIDGWILFQIQNDKKPN